MKVNKWKDAEEPDQVRMIAAMLVKSVETSITNHMYRFDGKMYKQTDGDR